MKKLKIEADFLRVANRGLVEKCCNYEQETITLRLSVSQLKDRVACQRAITDKVLDDLRDVNGELKAMVDDLPLSSVDFFFLITEAVVVCRVSHTVCGD